MKTFYITTTLPYVNAEPHVGFAMELVRADIIARWKKLEGFEVFFNTGTDEHGQKLFDAAVKACKPVQQYVDEAADNFKRLAPTLGVSEADGINRHFIRTTDAHHEKAAQEFWRRVALGKDEQGRPYIYKKNYKSKYCVGCEEAKTDSELVDGKCPIHPHMDIQIVEEENYFFRFSAFGDKLIALYDEKDDAKRHHVVPAFRMNEVREFIKRGLEDFSISRLKTKMAWGVPVPGDADHVMYVWFDALVNYISTLGWPESEAKADGDFNKFWKNGTPTQYCGKDNTRFQSVMWQAMLLAAGLPPTHTVVVNGFVTGDGGVKMSKSLGNVVNPLDIVNEYGAEALRYFVAREIGSFEDSPFTMERFKLAYNTNLANGLGNLVSRVMKMATTNKISLDPANMISTETAISNRQFADSINGFDIKAAADYIWSLVQYGDTLIQLDQPFKLLKSTDTRDLERGRQCIQLLLGDLHVISILLSPIMPKTAVEIAKLLKENKMPDTPLFLRKE